MHEVLFAHHFGVSRLAALSRLKALRLLNESKFDALKQHEEQGLGKAISDRRDLAGADVHGCATNSAIASILLHSKPSGARRSLGGSSLSWQAWLVWQKARSPRSSHKELRRGG